MSLSVILTVGRQVWEEGDEAAASLAEAPEPPAVSKLAAEGLEEEQPVIQEGIETGLAVLPCPIL